MTSEGLHQLATLGINIEPTVSGGGRAKPLCRPCLDWSERRSHLAGRLGIALCKHGLQKDWIRKHTGTRALEVTPSGWLALHNLFDIQRPTMA